jgi:hypothetical protein
MAGIMAKFIDNIPPTTIFFPVWVFFVIPLVYGSVGSLGTQITAGTSKTGQ